MIQRTRPHLTGLIWGGGGMFAFLALWEKAYRLYVEHRLYVENGHSYLRALCLEKEMKNRICLVLSQNSILPLLFLPKIIPAFSESQIHNIGSTD